MARTSVDLPAPLAPMIATDSLRSTPRDTPCSTGSPPYPASMFSTRSTGHTPR